MNVVIDTNKPIKIKGVLFARPVAGSIPAQALTPDVIWARGIIWAVGIV